MATLSNRRRRTLPPDDIDAQAITADSVSTNYRTMPCLVTGKTVLQPHLARQESLRRNIGHVAAETYLITRLAITLLRYLGIGYRWITQLLALGCYALLLMPGFLQVAYYYFSSPNVKRSLVYGDQPRNRFDLYLPSDIGEPKPVLIFVTGGAWIIGYKAWGSLLGLQLAERGIIVACLDYRNFPQGTISDMINDTCQGISFIINNIANYGGDPNRVYLMGQSAGAHISACALLEQAARESNKGENVSWSITQIKAYFGLSGGYNLLDLVDHFDNRGLYRQIFLSIMEGEESLKVYSPEIKIQDPCVKSAIPHFPPVYLVHGTADYSIPSVASERFADALKKAGARAELILCEGKSHTDLFLQDPLRGGIDYLFDHAVAVIHSNDSDALTKDAFAPRRKRFVPEILLKLATRISPF
ncbi:isoprenylcysteine alpha-carbonyl methylesterase ICME [Vigna radiata var. radiata]|uniref:protein-S-isoprenylcysteine alpha-carbonyl methylesterase n=1 Tax=Vigna radiata var. radiata TaxID=3916 RepID=A0A1S3W0M5_VIGRR|nr:isoprenylcysteine alpha-carbonyl methylesterase ICME [Vigna radiata var. radiata]